MPAARGGRGCVGGGGGPSRISRRSCRLSCSRAGMPPAVGELRLHEGSFGRGPCCASERACMLGYISRGFVTIVMNRPLKGRRLWTDLEPRAEEAAQSRGLGHRAKKPRHKYAIHWFVYPPLVCQHTLDLSVFTLNAHVWLTHTHTHPPHTHSSEWWFDTGNQQFVVSPQVISVKTFTQTNTHIVTCL